jgi:hypothetical protein
MAGREDLSQHRSRLAGLRPASAAVPFAKNRPPARLTRSSATNSSVTLRHCDDWRASVARQG